jgi:predicted short-subunit dehydrogenase-like oxidoreductase (DUF2520 family)
MKLSFIGAGNVAWHLSQALENENHPIIEVYSKSLDNATLLANKLFRCKAKDDLDFSDSKAEMFFLCVSDDAMEEVVSKLKLPKNAIVVHTSGSKTLADLDEYMEAFMNYPPKTGVFYPLQTFSKSVKLLFADIPICLETNDEEVENIMIMLAQDISEITYAVTSEERKSLHLAAVFACNFTNHLWGIAQSYLKEHELDFHLLEPLIRETLRKAMNTESIFDVQTGPAKRNDKKILANQFLKLKDKPEEQFIYRILTEAILKKAHHPITAK